MAPEVINAMENGTYDTAVDVWGLGITCIELGLCAHRISSSMTSFGSPVPHSLKHTIMHSFTVANVFLSRNEATALREERHVCALPHCAATSACSQRVLGVSIVIISFTPLFDYYLLSFTQLGRFPQLRVAVSDQRASRPTPSHCAP